MTFSGRFVTNAGRKIVVTFSERFETLCGGWFVTFCGRCVTFSGVVTFSGKFVTNAESCNV
mgnify:CR=1 FL=1